MGTLCVADFYCVVMSSKVFASWDFLNLGVGWVQLFSFHPTPKHSFPLSSMQVGQHFPHLGP